ncbi:MAG: hypothetical protein DRO04_01760, partial [Candidatus Iainarchaeum archaeon]
MIGVVIVGGGIVGLKLAEQLAKNGWSIKLIEEHKKIGYPVECSGLVSTNIMQHDLPLEECVVNVINGAKIYAPNGVEINVRRKKAALVLDRQKLDQELCKRVKKLKADVELSCKLINVRGNNLFVKKGQRGEMLKSEIIVGADGANSKVRELMQVKSKGYFINTIQARIKGDYEKDIVKVYFGDFAKGFFAWVIPESNNVARVGLGVKLGENIRECFYKFLRTIGIEKPELENITGGLIPIGPPIREVVKGNFAIVGDAAFHTKATTGGGIITGCIGAEILARCINGYFKNRVSLDHYKKEIEELNKELMLHWKLRRFLDSLNERGLNKFFAKIYRLGLDKFLEKEGDMDFPSKFMGKILF